MSPQALFTPIKVGEMELKHRIAMAPLTRFRANAAHEHVDVAVEYYTQRAHTPGTLIITEATFISEAAGAYNNAPGCYTDEQVAAWKRVVDAVHAKGCFIYLQLWALGRAADPEARGAPDVVSSGDIAFEGGATPRPLTEAEIKSYPGMYANAASNFVKRAGGDGVEIHGANGYLIDQFLQDSTVSNNRTDAYGGPVENRARFGLEVVAAVTAAVGPTHVGIRLSPYSGWQGMKMASNDKIVETWSYFVSQLVANHSTMAYIHCIEPRIAGISDQDVGDGESLEFLHKIWAPRPILVAGAYTPERAYKAAEEKSNVVVMFGRYFISNPDLVERVRANVALTPYNRDTFYLYGPENTQGYTDYPVSSEISVQA